MATKKDYAVGRGKPPAHTRFQKGRSGNPGGKPAPRKSFEERLRNAVEKALAKDLCDLEDDFECSQDAFDVLARDLVLGAAKGRPRDRATFLALARKFDEAGERSPPASASLSGECDVDTQTVTLSQGKSQGNFDNSPAGESITQPAEALSGNPALGSGNVSGDDDIAPPGP